jgi:FkbM family methyltransferase
MADKKIIDDRNREVAFYKHVLKGFRAGDLIFDIGANEGFKTDIFLRLGARVIAVDPDEANRTALREKFLTHRIAKKPVCVVGKAVSDGNGSTRLWIDQPGSAKNTLSEKWIKILEVDDKRFNARLSFDHSVVVETITLDDLMKQYGLPFFVKIDVEGHEVSVLRGLQRPVPYLSFEVNLPEFRSEGLKCIERLDQLAPSGLFNYIIGNHPQLASGWMDAGRVRDVLQRCAEDSIEVFWNTTGAK